MTCDRCGLRVWSSGLCGCRPGQAPETPRRSTSTVVQTRARDRVRRALETGKIRRQPCETCGAAKTRAHHDDYLRPLDIRWLCQSCHRKWHVANGAGLNADAPDPKYPRDRPSGDHHHAMRADFGVEIESGAWTETSNRSRNVE